MRLGDIIEIFFLGVIGTCTLASISALLYTFFKYPKIFGGIILLTFFIYIVGWCMKYWDKFYDLLFLSDDSDEISIPALPSCGIPTLDRLRDLEMKYNISTTQFLSFVYNNVMPIGIDNLDYLEWVSLVNDLPLLNKDTGE